jgi:hypothetical protein
MVEALIFSKTATILSPTGADDFFAWAAPYGCTVVSVKGFREGGTGATINARKNGSAEHLASDLSLTSADTVMDGGAVQNTTYAEDDWLEVLIQSVSGSPTKISIQVNFNVLIK